MVLQLSFAGNLLRNLDITLVTIKPFKLLLIDPV